MFCFVGGKENGLILTPKVRSGEKLQVLRATTQIEDEGEGSVFLKISNQEI